MKRRLSALAALVVGVSWLIAPSAAHAAVADQCWFNLDTGKSACFTTFAAVVADLSGGQVHTAGGASTFSASTSAAVTAASASTLYTIGIVYEDTYYGGASNTYTSTSPGCDASTSNIEFSVNNVGAAWNDTISSFHSYNGCRTKLWSDTYWGGTAYGFYGDKTTIGTMNDEASSIQWT